MFAIATPQTVDLVAKPWIDPAEPIDPNKPLPPPESHGTATFSHPHDDTSECELTIVSKDKTWTFRFNVNGAVISTNYEDDDIRAAKEAAAQKAKDDAKAAEGFEPYRGEHEPA